jgi:hypothetical protein
VKHGTPFRAAIAFATALAALATAHGYGTAAFQGALSQMQPYEGRGKHRARHHDQGGTRRAQRAARKARNIKRFRAQSRG